MELSRRSFFKRSLLAAGSGSAVAFASGSVRAEADCLKKPYKLESVKEVTNICCYCTGGCGTICSSRNGELINLEGDPDHPVNLGGLCPKGAAMWGLRNIVNPDRTVSAHPDRVIYPMVRRPGSTKWERISWDQAAKEIVWVQHSLTMKKGGSFRSSPVLSVSLPLTTRRACVTPRQWPVLRRASAAAP